MIDRSREDFYKEHMKRLGYTLQGELGCGDGSITYHVEYGEGFVLQFVRYFQKEKYVLEMKEKVQNIKNMSSDYLWGGEWKEEANKIFTLSQCV